MVLARLAGGDAEAHQMDVTAHPLDQDMRRLDVLVDDAQAVKLVVPSTSSRR
jgi:hypothetical protein